MSEPLRMIEFQINVLPDRALPTSEQLVALVELANRWKADVVTAGTGGGGLSPTYLGFSTYKRITDRFGLPVKEHLISGGIDQEGRIST